MAPWSNFYSGREKGPNKSSIYLKINEKASKEHLNGEVRM
jgi:hypothetical protein